MKDMQKAIVMALGLGLSTSALATEDWSDPVDDLQLPIMLADAHDVMEGAAEAASEEKVDNYEVCAGLRADRDADLGDVLRAGCEPTLS